MGKAKATTVKKVVAKVPARKTVAKRNATKTVPKVPAKKTTAIKKIVPAVLKPSVKPATKKVATNNKKNAKVPKVSTKKSAEDAKPVQEKAITGGLPKWLESVSIKPLKPLKKPMSFVDAMNACNGEWGRFTSQERQRFFDSHGLKTQTQIELLFCIAGLAQEREEPPKMSTADAAKWKEVSAEFRDEDEEEDDEDDENYYERSFDYDRVISYRDLGPFLPFMKYYTTEKEAQELIKTSCAKY